MDEMKKMNQVPLTDAELENVTGGREIFDKKGREVGWTTITEYNQPVIHYRVCPECGKAMHKGKNNAYYCDPCDCWKLFPPDVAAFFGSEQEFLRTMVVY